MIKRKRSPQEDKILSHTKDRRNTYGENDKSSRKAIRFRKRWVNGTYRSQIHDALGAAARDPDEIADAVSAVQRKRWRKVPDGTRQDLGTSSFNWFSTGHSDGLEPGCWRLTTNRLRNTRTF